MTRIQEFSDLELITELMARNDNVIICTRKSGIKGPDTVERRRYWKGEYDIVAGMAQAAMLDALITCWKISPDDIQ